MAPMSQMTGRWASRLVVPMKSLRPAACSRATAWSIAGVMPLASSRPSGSLSARASPEKISARGLG
ncbi:MAG: hypothetical protein NTV86_22135 [Planctomycetota bacterium]|nr:hypothetical protein [Planctomycetota bacterium]